MRPINRAAALLLLWEFLIGRRSEISCRPCSVTRGERWWRLLVKFAEQMHGAKASTIRRFRRKIWWRSCSFLFCTDSFHYNPVDLFFPEFSFFKENSVFLLSSSSEWGWRRLHRRECREMCGVWGSETERERTVSSARWVEIWGHFRLVEDREDEEIMRVWKSWEKI